MPGASVGPEDARSPRWILTPLAAGVVVAALSVWVFHELAEDVALSPRIAAFDAQLGAVIRSWRTPTLTTLFSAATWSASTIAVAVVVLIAVGALVWRCRHREALVMAVVVGPGMVLGAIAKRVTERPRPPAALALVELPTSYSFPSGHTLAALLLWTAIAFAVLRVARRGGTRVLAVGGGLIATILVGTSRVYLGVHWPSDVLASWFLGIAWLSVTLGGFLSWERWCGDR